MVLACCIWLVRSINNTLRISNPLALGSALCMCLDSLVHVSKLHTSTRVA